MMCSKCNKVGILNSANGKDFYYCRTCKTEILLEEVKKDTQSEMIDIDEIIKLLDADKVDGDVAAYFNFPSNDPNDYDDSPSDDDDDSFDPFFNVGPTSDLRIWSSCVYERYPGVDRSKPSVLFGDMTLEQAKKVIYDV